MARLGFELQNETLLVAMTEEFNGFSDIEGKFLDRRSVGSSVARRFGIGHGAIDPADRRTEGIFEMMIDETGNCQKALTPEWLFGWQAAHFPTGLSGLKRIMVGEWRDDANRPMRVVSGPIGRERLHFRGPPAELIELEITRLLAWFNCRSEPEGLLRAGFANLWLATIHPFEDGNGRVARAIAEQA